MSKTVWTHAYWDDTSIWWREAGSCAGTARGRYFPYANDLTGGNILGLRWRAPLTSLGGTY